MKPSILLVPLLVVGCAHTELAKKVTVPKPATVVRSQPNLTADAGIACGSDIDCGSGELCIDSHCKTITAGMAQCREASVHFDFDSSVLGSADRDSLERGARCLRADHALHVRIEGNADERGTEEYNLALGDQRAVAVEKYLETLGVSAGQLATVSYGKERPLCTEHDEGCWSQNRRADMSLAMSRSRATR